MPWSAEEYARSLTPRQDGTNIIKETNLMDKFPPPEHIPGSFEDQPLIVMDNTGIIILWYIPMLFTRRTQVSAQRPVFSILIPSEETHV
jgi:hypothetical protein